MSKRSQRSGLLKSLAQWWQLIFNINLNEAWLFATPSKDHQCDSNAETKYSVPAAVVREGSSEGVSEASRSRQAHTRELVGTALRHKEMRVQGAAGTEGRWSAVPTTQNPITGMQGDSDGSQVSQLQSLKRGSNGRQEGKDSWNKKPTTV